MNIQNSTQKEFCPFPHQNSIVINSNLFFPSPQKLNFLVKPDFSPITAHEEKFGLKTNDSYKKRTKKELDSPVKTPSTNYFSPIKIEGKDLFGTKKDKEFCRKLNFDEIDNKEYKSNYKITDIEMKHFLNKFNISDDNTNFNSMEPYRIMVSPSLNNVSNTKKNENKMGSEYTIYQTIKEKNYDGVYIVKEIKTGKLYCIKKNSKNPKKNSFKTILSTLNDLNNKKNIEKKSDLLLGEQFCMKQIDYWIKNENNINKYLYILLEYYPLGDILDYFGKLIENNYLFTSNFCWDIIFEMICGLLYFHNKGYIHFDIKPTNFLVDNNGYIKLNDFDLSHKVEELSFLDDIIEGDSRYISKELFDDSDNISMSNLDNRCDVFSLGLSLLEILFRVDLPKNGKLWRDIRNDNFSVPKEFLNNLKIENNKEFMNLINFMITPINKRPTLLQLIEKFPELNKRYELLKNNKYSKSSDIMKFEMTLSKKGKFINNINRFNDIEYNI